MTVFNNLINKMNKKQGSNPASIGSKILTEYIDVGEAIISFFSTTGIAGFKFHIPQRERIRLENDITDHYLDNNRPVQDHIAQKPVTLTLEGLQGEYLYSVDKLETISSALAVALPLVKQFVPSLGEYATQIKSKIKVPQRQNKVIQARDLEALNSADNLSFVGDTRNINDLTFGATESESAENNVINYFDLWALMQQIYKLKSSQTRAFLFFEALWKSQAIFTVDTTWKRYNNMVIQSIEALRDENLDITNFVINCKQMNFAESIVIRQANTSAGRRKAQESSTAKKGVDKGLKVGI